MFERFTDAARRVVVHAQEEARERRAHRIGPEHLLLGVVRCSGTPGAELLRGAGVDAAVVEQDLLVPDPHDARALAALGIDLDAVRRAAEEAFGLGALDRRRRGWSAGHIRFAPASKKTLELALREAVRLSDRQLGSEHLLLGLLHPDHAASRLLARRGVTLEGMRLMVEQYRDLRAG